jgi:hypothetical protein
MLTKKIKPQGWSYDDNVMLEQIRCLKGRKKDNFEIN